jgi:hypothetical protein
MNEVYFQNGFIVNFFHLVNTRFPAGQGSMKPAGDDNKQPKHCY